jgi:hypothetical protein
MKSIVLTLNQEEITRQKRSYISQLTLLFLFISLLFLSTRSFGQCEMKFEYEVENCSEGKSDGKIYLKMIDGEGSFTVKLYDLPKSRYVDEKTLTFQKYNKTIVFQGLSLSAYTIFIFKSGCEDHLNVGDKYGIVVSRR